MDPSARVVTALERLKETFLEVPDTELSLSDAATLSGFDSSLCGLVLDTLVDRRFLILGPNGTYRRNGPTAEELTAFN
jgi:hypothetical protein